MSKKDVNIVNESSPTPVGKWLEFSMIEKDEGFPIGVKALALIFKSSLGIMDVGIIKGNVRIKNSEETYSFSTAIHDKSNPLFIQNLWIPEKKQYQHFPIIEYIATQKSEEDAVLQVSVIGLQMDT